MPSGWDSIQEPNRAIASYIGTNKGWFPREEIMSTDTAQFWIIDIILPAILLIVLIWLVMKRRSNRATGETEAGTRNLYREEEQRRREGTDQAEK